MAEKKNEFEKKLSKLEGIVSELENGDVGLDDMLALFEKGIRLTRECSDRLSRAEQKITMLVRGADGEIEEKPFETAE